MKSILATLSIAALLVAVIAAQSGSDSSQDTNKVIAESLEVAAWEKLMKENPGTVLDVRTQEEFDRGSVPNAVLIDWYSDGFNEKVGKLDKSTPVYVYCHSGGRSKRAMARLTKLGFDEVYNLIGGITAWNAAHP